MAVVRQTLDQAVLSGIVIVRGLGSVSDGGIGLGDEKDSAALGAFDVLAAYVIRNAQHSSACQFGAKQGDWHGSLFGPFASPV